MPRRIITELTEEQEAMIAIYRDKWRKIAISTEPINHEKVAAVIKAAYAVSDYSEPKILFYSNPLIAIQKVLAIENFKAYLGRNIHIKFLKRVIEHIQHGINQQLEYELFIRLRNQIQFPEFPYYPTASHPQTSYFPYGIKQRIEQQLITDLNQYEIEFTDLLHLTQPLTRTAEWAILGCMLDFCISVLAINHDKKKWQVFQDLIQYCGLISKYEKVCIVCERPCKVSFDQENILHAEGEAAVQFADGYSVYAYHGVRLPEKYGKLPPTQWSAKWLLEEDNAELRRMLIQGIGYTRILEHLQAVELDSWQEYTLLKIDSDIDVEPIYLLKMTCPSTQKIHVLRVPPDIQSAKDAICWVNWGIAPEEFSVQT
ncbi:hypothetical protein NIES4103_44640 [Nostoc sp. NIES-4103]|nr:hypothetical protein NIES4103_44640 [Nostoc sp. NIES-4103]